MKFFQCIAVYILLGFLFSGCAETPSRIRDIAEKPESRGRMHLDTRPEDGYADFRHESTKADAVSVFPADKPSADAANAEKQTVPVQQDGKSVSDRPAPLYREKDVYVPSSRSPSGKADPSSDGDVVFNFDNADLYEVIRTMAELLHINYMVDPGISGTVTVQTAGKLKEKDLFTVFYQVLEANGLTAVEEGSLYKIIPLKDASRMPLYSRMGRQARDIPQEERIVIQIIPLRHISAQEMSKLIVPFVSAQGTIVTHEDSKSLVVVDRNANVQKVLKLVSSFDIDMFQTLMHRFYSMVHMDAEEAAKLLTEIFAVYGKGEDKNFRVIAIARLNKILAISSESGVFDTLENLLRQIDLPSDSAEPRIYVYSVKNGEAEEISDLLNTVFAGNAVSEKKSSAAKSEEKDKTLPNLFAPSKSVKDKTASKTDESKSNVRTDQNTEQKNASGTLRGDVRIIADKTRNALLIEAVPSDYHLIEGILRRIDVLPRQVLIEVIIAEISLDNKDELGMEWSYDKSLGEGKGLSLLTGNIGSGGLKFKVGDDRWWAQFSALASKNNLNVLSAPVLLASDNKEATINVTDQIPVPSAEYLYDSGTTGVTQTNIQYRDTGIILTVTPHINERGLVSMDMAQEVSEVGDDKTVAGKIYPTFRERKVTTTLTVKHGQTIVIGGLMREQSKKGINGVPFLSQIPFIGFLFGKDETQSVKTELILLITPRVIVNSDDVDVITDEFRQKVSDMRERIANSASPFQISPEAGR